MPHQLKPDALRETAVQRNPHENFDEVQSSRAEWDRKRAWNWSQTSNPGWSYGDGANDKSGLSKEHVAINPYEQGRSPLLNYKLLISGMIPRPVGFLSTRGKDGKTANLAPFSYTQVFNHDPPIFGVGFAGGFDNVKDSLTNLVETRECVINMISEHFIEAANACAMDLPYGTSEWSISGLTPAKCEVVKPDRVKESIFAIEGRMMSMQEFESKVLPGRKTGVLALIEGVRFWVREDAINEEKSLIDPAVMKPIARLGGITYARVTDGFEIPRPVMKMEIADGKLDEEILHRPVQES